jgi:endonuclease/exonuclease/phosphatase family metal-dependent hydrolase
VLCKYLITLNPTIPVILCGDLNDTPEQQNSYFKTTILPVRNFVDSYKHVALPSRPSPAKRQKTKEGKEARKVNICPGSTYYAEDDSRSKLPLVDPLDRTDVNGVRQVTFCAYMQCRLLLHRSTS